MVEFMQWRWFVDRYDDGAHFRKGADSPHTVAVTDIAAAAIPAAHTLGAMVYGANFFRVNTFGTADSFTVTIDSSDVDVPWRLLDVDSGDVVAPVTLMPDEDVVLVAVVLQTEEIWSGNLSFNQRIADLEFTVVP